MHLPCGRLTADRHLCCTRKHHWWNTYWVKMSFGWELRYLFCHQTIVITNYKMTFKNYIFKNELFNWED